MIEVFVVLDELHVSGGEGGGGGLYGRQTISM